MSHVWPVQSPTEQVNQVLLDVFIKNLEGLILKDAAGVYEPAKR